MRSEIWMVIVIVALGTYALRVIPLIWTQRHLSKRDNNHGDAKLPVWISVLGPLMIASMLGVSLIPKSISAESWVATIIAVVGTVIIWRKFGGLGIPVLLGVSTFGLVYGIGSMLPSF
ncbi:AzlD domain-containing protein [Agaribacter flavus]|uniref:AzlD domain-containing protein n=1 Tax=Agaribacter flavus TaxID=1902781 RepID=A0ABV7FIU9_9ALTE